SVPASYVFDTVRSTSKPLKHRLTQQRDNPLELNSSSNNLINNKRRHERSHSSSQQEAPKRARLTSKCLGKKMNKKDNTILRSSRTNIIKIENNDNEQSYTNGHSSIHDEHDTDDDNCQRQEEANNSTIIQREKRKILKQKSTNNDIDSPELNTTNNSTKTSVELGDSSSNNVFDLFEEYDEDGIPQQTSVSDSPLEKVSKEGTSISIPMKSNISNSRMKTKMNGSITSTAANAKQFANQHSLLVPSATSSISPDTKMHIHALLSKYIDRSVCVDPIEMNVRHTIDALLSAVDSLVSSSLSNGIGSSMKMSLLSSTFEHTTKLLDIPSPSSTTLEQDAAASISKELQSTNTNFISSTCDNERLAAVVVLSDCLLPNHSSEEQQLEQKKVEPLKLNHTTPNIIPQRMTLKHSRKSRQQQRITTPSVHNVNNSMLMHNQVQKTVILNDYSQEQLPKQVLLSPNTDSIEHPSLLSQISTTKQQPVTVVQDTYTDSSHLRVRPLNGTSASFESIDTQNVKSEPIDTIYERISPLAMAQSPPSPTTSPTITKSVSQLNFETRSNREHHLLPFGANQINSTISSKTIHPLTNTMHSRNTVRPTINGSLTAATRVSDTTPSSFQQRYTQQQPAIRTTPTNVRTPASSSQRMDSKTSSPSLQFSDYQSGSTIHNPQQQQSRRSSTVNYTATSTSPSISLSPSNRHFVRIPPLNNCPIRATTDSRTSDEIQTIINNFSDKFQHMMTEFSAQIDAALETNRRRYEKELDETRRAYRTSINELRSITTQQVNEMRTSLELQYWNRMSDMRNRYEHTLQQMKTSSKSSNIPNLYENELSAIENELVKVRTDVNIRANTLLQLIKNERDALLTKIDNCLKCLSSSFKHGDIQQKYESIRQRLSQVFGTTNTSHNNEDIILEMNDLLKQIAEREEQMQTNPIKYPSLTACSSLQLSKIFGELRFISKTLTESSTYENTHVLTNGSYNREYNENGENEQREQRFVERPEIKSRLLSASCSLSSSTTAITKTTTKTPLETMQCMWSVDFRTVPHFLCIVSKKNDLLFSCDRHGIVGLYQFHDHQFNVQPRPLRTFQLETYVKQLIVEAFTVYTPFIIVAAHKTDQTDTCTIYVFDHRGVPVHEGIHQKFPIRHLLADIELNCLWGIDRHQHCVYHSVLIDQSQKIELSLSSRQTFLSFFGKEFEPIKICQNKTSIGILDKKNQSLHIYDKRTKQKIDEIQNQFRSKGTYRLWNILLCEDNCVVLKLDEEIEPHSNPTSINHIILQLDEHGCPTKQIEQINVYGITLTPDNGIILGCKKRNDIGSIEFYK
ncbi:unnamed protein product, partial [Didymodactylos carnosus]